MFRIQKTNIIEWSFMCFIVKINLLREKRIKCLLSSIYVFQQYNLNNETVIFYTHNNTLYVFSEIFFNRFTDDLAAQGKVSHDEYSVGDPPADQPKHRGAAALQKAIDYQDFIRHSRLQTSNGPTRQRNTRLLIRQHINTLH